MRLFILASIIVLIIVLLAACEAEKIPAITVAVFPGGERCVIDEQTVNCSDAVKYLRDTLKAPIDRPIDVSMQINKSDKSADVVAKTIKDAGFTDVRSWHFGFN